MGGNYYYTNNLDHNHTFDAGAGYKVVMEIKNNWRTKGLYVDDGAYIFDRLGFRTRETSGSNSVNGNVPWFRKTAQIEIGENVWGGEPGSMGDGWILPPNKLTLNGTYDHVRGTAVNGFIPINYVGDAQIICWHFWSDDTQMRPRWEIKITRVAGSDNAGSDNALNINY